MILNDCKEASEKNDSGTVYKNLKMIGKKERSKAATTNLTGEDFKEQFMKVSKDCFENSPDDINDVIEMIEDISQTDIAKEWTKIAVFFGKYWGIGVL